MNLIRAISRLINLQTFRPWFKILPKVNRKFIIKKTVCSRDGEVEEGDRDKWRERGRQRQDKGEKETETR